MNLETDKYFPRPTNIGCLNLRRGNAFLPERLEHSKNFGGLFDERKRTKKRRSHFGLHSAILRVLALESLTLNQVVIRVNLNRRVAQRCLHEMLKENLVETHTNAKFPKFAATEKGIHWLREYSKLTRE
jgi:predicted transcriptional regulator